MEDEIIIGRDGEGQPITKGKIDALLKDIEGENYAEFKDALDCMYEQMALADKTETITFDIPESEVEELSKFAKDRNCSMSELIYAFIIDGLLRADTADKDVDAAS